MYAVPITSKELNINDYFDIKESKNLLNISEKKLRTAIREGYIRVFLLKTRTHIGYKYFLSKEDIFELKLILLMKGYYKKK